jgi:phosphatidylserine/phosphatidylglycerophosphate/cardiolipin synthase-like enzyme
VDAFELTDGGQRAEDVAAKVVDFMRPARRSLDIALYDLRLPGPPGDAVAAELRAAAGRGVVVRLLYNVDSGRPSALHPPPSTRPDLLADLPIETKPVPGIPDLMHHKYAIRDGEAVWTGSANWTVDSWTRQENVLISVASQALAAAYEQDFEGLWERPDVEHSGRVDPAEIQLDDGVTARAWFTPGHGEDLSHAIATAIAKARRVRIASPVITSAPVLSALAEAGAERDIAGIVDEPQTDVVFGQWQTGSQWKIPLLAAALTQHQFSGKPSTPWGPGTTHDFMHAKVTVADNTVFLGSFNLSRSGEKNAENMLEVRDSAFADHIRARYPATTVPERAMATMSAASSATRSSSKSSGEIRPGSSSSARTQANSPAQ